MVHAAYIMRRAIVAGEDDDGVFLKAACFQRLQQAAHIVVHLGDHAGIGRPGTGMGQIAVFSLVGALVPAARVTVNPFLQGLHGHVGFQRGVIQEEGRFSVCLPSDEFQYFICNQIGTVFFRAVGVRQHFPLRLGAVLDGDSGREVLGIFFFPSFRR